MLICGAMLPNLNISRVAASQPNIWDMTHPSPRFQLQSGRVVEIGQMTHDACLSYRYALKLLLSLKQRSGPFIFPACRVSCLDKHGVEEPLSVYESVYALRRPIDVHRSYLAATAPSLLLLDCDPKLTYEAIQSAITKDNGDLALILPKLELKVDKPKQIAFESLKKGLD
ncbi:uncharacterized protein BCR38DRAFT_407220 [Pseudomassariella vexata]|uniref:Uncharacterized protein n=1 Tax=Pseudomassariella vexata TaxID=1141098 RepID=A0A1Y2E6R3_9PEZI|nr:uncharacterized protein BCR38DRAFT_407220 [Pseudomassariella vexata]ORY67222.1 hypothetical protein BCR38DRAFT_407220 [Pseudomassariella vexata]